MPSVRGRGNRCPRFRFVPPWLGAYGSPGCGRASTRGRSLPISGNAFSQAGVTPVSTRPERGSYARWRFFAAGTLELAVIRAALGGETEVVGPRAAGQRRTAGDAFDPKRCHWRCQPFRCGSTDGTSRSRAPQRDRHCLVGRGAGCLVGAARGRKAGGAAPSGAQGGAIHPRGIATPEEARCPSSERRAHHWSWAGRMAGHYGPKALAGAANGKRPILMGRRQFFRARCANGGDRAMVRAYF